MTTAEDTIRAAVCGSETVRILDCRGMHAPAWRPELGYWTCGHCGVPLDEQRREGGLAGHWLDKSR